MKVYNSLQNIAVDYPNIKFGMTIGNFDGVHLGHQSLIEQSKSFCDREGLKLILLSFNPHPKELFSPDLTDFYIIDQNQKKNKLESLGVDVFCELNFDHSLSIKTSTEFLNDLLAAQINIAHLILGYDFKFGADKEKSIEVSKEFCTNNGIQLDVLSAFKISDKIVSSSAIRELIKCGEIQKANSFLGHEFSIEGKVSKGKGRGKELGFPTANLSFDVKRIVPSSGVYKTSTLLNGINYSSITNVGCNPTFSDVTGKHVETHIFDLDKDIYGENIEITFSKKIRDEIKFNSLDELKNQITKDIVEVKREVKC